MKLLIATKNKGKFMEISEVLAGLPVELISLKNLGLEDEVEEHGSTHEANAILKAQYFFKKTGLPTVGEDSGIHVDMFPGELGVFTRRWGGLGNATDEEWIKYFLKKTKGAPAEKKGAKFVCVAALILNAEDLGKPMIFSGETRGVITEKLEVPLIKGIPISSCFRPDGCDKVYAALGAEEKNKISHRGKAIHKLREHLARNIKKK